jgi:hypothetical protein
MGDMDWYIKVGLIAIPAVIYLLMLLPCKFPIQERQAAGVSDKEMLGEFGVLGALVVGFLVTLQLIDFAGQGGAVVTTNQKYLFIAIGAVIVIGFGLYTKALGNKLLFFLVLIMMPLATTEIGTDGWIEGIMKGVAKEKFDAGWVLVYTSLIMMVLRFYAGPIVHKFKPLPLLAISSVFAIVGLYTLSFTEGMVIFAAATLYGIGKTFFWPTMLGVVSEQTPKGGALTLNAISGIGMLAVGTLGFPYIGALQAGKQIEAISQNEAIVAQVPSLKDGNFTTSKSIYEVIKYDAVDEALLAARLSDDIKDKEKLDAINGEIKSVKDASAQGALADMATFPIIMLIAYLILLFHFKNQGGYKPVEL